MNITTTMSGNPSWEAGNSVIEIYEGNKESFKQHNVECEGFDRKKDSENTEEKKVIRKRKKRRKKSKINRTVTLYPGNREEYDNLLKGDGLPHFRNIIQASDRVKSFQSHRRGCAGTHRFTRHATYTRSSIGKNGENNPIKITQWRCLDCDSVWTVQPSFIIRYKRLDTYALELMTEGMFIQNVSIRGIKHLMSLPVGLSAILGYIQANRLTLR